MNANTKLEDQLDEGLEESFPASDSLAVHPQPRVIFKEHLMSSKTFRTSVSLPETQRAPLTMLLNQHLGTLLTLYSQTKQAHWNVKGKDFIQLHELFDDIATNVLEHLDNVAERAVQLGGVAVKVATQDGKLPAYPLEAIEGQAHLEALAERYGIYANFARASIDQANHLNDANTADLFTEISRVMDKHLWFLEAHLQA